jgi:aspartate ammonia-lyase
MIASMQSMGDFVSLSGKLKGLAVELIRIAMTSGFLAQAL